MMAHIVHLSSVHNALDKRLFHRKARVEMQTGHSVTILASYSGDCTIENVRIIRIHRFNSRFLRMIFTTSQIFWKARRIKADVFHVEDPEMLPWSILLRRITHIPVIYDAKEYYAANVSEKEYIPQWLKGTVARATEKLEKSCVRQVDGVTVVNKHMKELYAPYCERVAIVQNFPWRSSIPQTSQPRDPKKIVYVGWIGKKRGYEILLEALKKIRAKDSEAYCVIAGPLPYERLSQTVRDGEQELISRGVLKMLGEVPYEQVWEHLASAAVGWIPWGYSLNQDLGLPNKLFEYMGSGLPLVIPQLRFMAEIVQQVGCGFIVPAGDAAAHAQAVLSLLHDPERARQMGERGREAVLSKYNWETTSRALMDLYAAILDMPSQAPMPAECSSKKSAEDS